MAWSGCWLGCTSRANSGRPDRDSRHMSDTYLRNTGARTYTQILSELLRADSAIYLEGSSTAFHCIYHLRFELFASPTNCSAVLNSSLYPSSMPRPPSIAKPALPISAGETISARCPRNISLRPYSRRWYHAARCYNCFAITWASGQYTSDDKFTCSRCGHSPAKIDPDHAFRMHDIERLHRRPHDSVKVFDYARYRRCWVCGTEAIEDAAQIDCAQCHYRWDGSETLFWADLVTGQEVDLDEMIRRWRKGNMDSMRPGGAERGIACARCERRFEHRKGCEAHEWVCVGRGEGVEIGALKNSVGETLK